MLRTLPYDMLLIICAAISLTAVFVWWKWNTRNHHTHIVVPAHDADFDVVVIGAGVVGSALAVTLGRQGKRVLVIESNLEEPDRIVGELMQPRGVETLKKLDLEESISGIDAQLVGGYAVYYDGSHFSTRYPDNKKGVGFHNGRFVMQLRKIARASPNVKITEGNVSEYLFAKVSSPDQHVIGVKYLDKSDSQIKSVTAHLTILAAGCLTPLRKLFVEEPASKTHLTMSRFMGFVLEQCPSVYEETANVFLANPTPVLCYPVGTNEMRVLVDFPHDSASILSGNKDELKEHLLTTIMPYFPQIMHDSFRNAISKGKFQSMPNQSMTLHVTPSIKGAMLIGDALNMRHPLTGGGMTVGLKDVEVFGELIRHWNPQSRPSCDLQGIVAEFYSMRQQPNAVINILADALYKVFSQQYAELREGCFHYLSCGEAFRNGPISFLAGINESQSFLLFHFFGVAIFALFRLALLKLSPLRAYKALRDAVHIIHPLVLRSGTDIGLRAAIRILRVMFPF